MGLFRDLINEARNTSVPTEYRIALGQLKRMYNSGEVPEEKELKKDAEMIAKKNHLEEDKFFEFVKSQFKINESKKESTPTTPVQEILSEAKITKSDSGKYTLIDGVIQITKKELAKIHKDYKTDKTILTMIGGVTTAVPFTINESAVGTPGRTTIKDAEEHINDELIAEFKKIIKKLGGKTVAKVLLDKLAQKPEIKDEIEHIEDIIDNSNY